MGSVRRFTHASGKRVWQARWRDPAGKQRNKNFDRKVDAERYLVTVESRKLTGDYVDPRLGKMRFSEWCDKVESSRIRGRPSTRDRDAWLVRSLIRPTFDDVPIGSVQPMTVRQWLAELSDQGYAASTVRMAYQILARIFDAAVESGLLARTPCRGVKLPKIEETEKRFLSPEEIIRLAESIHPRYRAFVLTGAYSGARFGELAALDLDHYEPLRRTIRIERTLSEVNGKLRLTEPKTRASVRSVTLPEWLVKTLAQHLTEWPPSENGLLFSAPEGGYLRRSFRDRFWRPAVAESVGEPMRAHDLRHTHVALLISEGVHPAIIASRLGHTSVKTVLDVYGHLYEGLDRDAADTLQAPWDTPDVVAMWSRDASDGNPG
ncbi:MAG TPA: site-specific integrase [Acidimicrobiia bacterium]|jgi:integrase|nr:site-specific integrase [Acidimicrobiia bacterium]